MQIDQLTVECAAHEQANADLATKLAAMQSQYVPFVPAPLRFYDAALGCKKWMVLVD